MYYAVPAYSPANILAIFYLTTVLNLSTAVTGAFMLLYAAGAMVAMLISGAVYNRTGAGDCLLSVCCCTAAVSRCLP